MNLEYEFQAIRDWASEKGIYEKGSVKSQYNKLLEEVNELYDGIENKDIDEVKDAIGDCVVVLTNLAHLAGLTIEDCINSSYGVIKNRTGKMINGSFVKDK